MVYTCNNCNFTFSRVGEIETCPGCGKDSDSFIREATEQEKRDYEKYQCARGEHDEKTEN